MTRRRSISLLLAVILISQIVIRPFQESTYQTIKLADNMIQSESTMNGVGPEGDPTGVFVGDPTEESEEESAEESEKASPDVSQEDIEEEVPQKEEIERVIQEDSPIEDKPADETVTETEEDDTISLEDEETPSSEDEETPSSEDEETPSSEDEETPSSEDEETPSSEDEETPSSEDEETPLSEDEETPSSEDEEATVSEIEMEAVVVPEAVAANSRASIVLGESDIPTTLEALESATTNTYSISNYQGWLNLQELSKVSSLEGYTFTILARREGGSDIGNYDFVELNSLNAVKFEGLGTETTPFKGTMYADYTTGIALKLETPLFQYLSTKADIHDLLLEPQGACAGVAAELMVESQTFAGFYDIIVSAADTGIRGAVAGGLFANVTNETGAAFLLKRTNEDAGTEIIVNAAVSGQTAGGLIGIQNGDITMVLDGGIQWSPSTTPLSGATAVGGWIGAVNNADVIIQSGAASGIEYVNTSAPTWSATNMGGLFGTVSNGSVQLEASVVYTSEDENCYIYGDSAGGFAGMLDRVDVNLQKSFIVNGIKISQGKNSDTEWGSGGFAGVIKNATIDTAAEAEIQIIDVTVENKVLTNKTYNVGGFVGYARNAYLLFSESVCSVNNFTAVNTYGNAAGAVGLYEADSTMAGTVVQNISVTGTTTVSALNGNAAGLIAKMSLVNCDVKVQNCYGESLVYAAKNAISLGIGEITAEQTEAKLTITGIVLKGVVNKSTNDSVQAYGGMIGSADIDLVVEGAVDQNGYYDTAVETTTRVQHAPQYVGGLIGTICQSGDSKREVDIANVLVGNPGYDWRGMAYSYGGLIGKTEDKTSVCLDKKLCMNGGKGISWQNKLISVGKQVTEIPYRDYGSVVGSQNYSLIYLQPTAELIKSDQYKCDEVGNYGGVFRNGNWDYGTFGADGTWIPEDTTDESKWLIQNHKVTGAWKYYGHSGESPVFEMNTIGDWMRLAILGNTNNRTTIAEAEWGDGFYPTEVTGYSGMASQNDLFWGVLTGAFYLTESVYDLRGTGIVSMFRNDAIGITGGKDNEGNKRYASGKVANSFVAATEATIKYDVTVYSHPYVGLFPCLDGLCGSDVEKTVRFENIHLDYNIKLEKLVYVSRYLSDKEVQQRVGGLSALAVRNVTLNNVSYTGTIDDNKNQNNSKSVGGLIGSYEGVKDRTLSITNLTTQMNFNYQHNNGGVGGVVGLVYLPGDGICNINVDTVSLNGTITAEHTTEGKAMAASAFITQLYSSSKNPDGIYLNLSVENLTIGEVTLCAQDTGVEFYAMGGFLGYTWECANVTLKNVKIGQNAPAVLSAKAQFGGLVHDVKGKMYIQDLAFGSQTKIDTHGIGSHCGLIVRKGCYLYLDVDGYTVDGVILDNYGDDDFDELVGKNKDGDNKECGGIVNIHTEGTDASPVYHLGRNGAVYSSYVYGMNVHSSNGESYKRNKYTRYYYDLDKLDFSIDYSTIDSSEALMVWHIMHYANDYIVDYCLAGENSTPKYAANALPASYTISGRIDMTGYSIYPTTIFKGESYAAKGATIIFNAQDIYEGETALAATVDGCLAKYPGERIRQHNQMQAGLFFNVYGGISVDGLTLSGTYSYLQNASDVYEAGALVCGNIYGIENGTDSKGQQLYKDVVSRFTNMTLDNLWCVTEAGKVNQNNEALALNSPLGLMVSSVSSGAKINMDGIYMSGYADADVASGDKAASALIGNVGSEDATYISLNFKNIDIMDAAAGKSSSALNSTKKEEVLGRASLIYAYNYKENCSGIYTFTSEDYLVGKLGVAKLKDYEDVGVVTLGEELGNQEYAGINYAEVRYYDNEDSVGMASKREDGSTDHVAEIPFDCYNYLPYVYAGNQEILVNPKIADIEEGCGTYEDPYVISSTTQLLTVYRYLYEEELYAEVLGMLDNEWKIHATGDDTYFCDGTENETGHGALIAYEKERSEDSQFPTKEELSQAYYLITGDIDLSSYPEFVGFGREDMPFVGVFAGDADPIITLLEQEAGSTISQYAFIQVAKGVVVKDLTIHFNSTINIDSATNAIGAGVIGMVAGGENIIDNVSIESTGTCFSVQKESAVIGGYVGVVELGGVILRNMNAFSLSQFSVGAGTGVIADYPYVGKIAGKVLDGYLVYDGIQGAAIPLFANTTIGTYVSNGQLPLCSTYDILNGAYLSGTQVVWNGAGYKIADNKGLQIISMALNSGMLNYNQAAGYASDSRQRCGDYSGVKNVYDSSDVRYIQAKQDDSATFADSYLWQFFVDASGNMLATANSGGLNPTLSEGGAILTYELTGAEYDMTGFQMGFRGLGARYHGTEYASDNTLNRYITEPQLLFQSNFVGSSAENPTAIKINMQVSAAMDSYRAALLNEIPNAKLNADQKLTIANIVLSGTVVNKGSKIIYSNNWKPEVDYNAAGFASDTLLGVEFKNVTLDNLTVDATGYAGGLLGCVRERRSTNVYVNDVVLSNLTVVGGNDSKTAGVLNGDAGGIIGTVESGQYLGSKIYIGTADGTYAEDGTGVTGNNVTVYTRGKSSAAGGLIGRTEARTDSRNYISTTYIYNSVLQNLTVYAANAYNDAMNSAGGIVGHSSVSDLCIKNVTIGSEKTDETVTIILKGENTTMDEEELVISALSGGVGGFVGRLRGYSNSVIQLEDSSILGTVDDFGESTTRVQGYNNAGGVIGLEYCIGASISNCTVKGIAVKGLCFVGGCIGSNTINIGTTSMENVSITGCCLSLYTLAKKGSTDLLWTAGDIGGLMGSVRSDGNHVQIKDCSVANCVIAPDYTRAAGGFIGSVSRKVSVSGENTIENNVICGDIAGGVFGNYNSNVAGNGIEGITISKNKIVSCVEHDISYRSREYLAGGFAGKIDTYQSLGCIEGIVSCDNLIGAYNDSNTSYLGGVFGVSNAETYFYDTQLKDNYIGTFKAEELQEYAESEWQAVHGVDTVTEYSVMKQQLLKNTTVDTLKAYLYVKPKGETADAMLVSLSSLRNISEDAMHQYSYYQGAVAGKLHADTSRINTFVDLNIQYKDNTYRPVSDVGMTSEKASMEAVYEAYRPQFFVVYDSKETEEPIEENEYAGFTNLKEIWDEYADTENADRRYAYRLNENYLAGADSDIALATIYQETYYKKGNYVSDFVDADGNIIPMLIFRTTDNGTLDEVIQSYVNMLTNNSGALNTYAHQIIAVTTTKMRLVEGKVLEEATGQAAVQVTASKNKYKFVNEADGTRLYDKMTDEKNVTFTLIQIEYKYGDQTKWTLEIPVYVEQELEFDSHMRLVKGIEYNVNTVKAGAYCEPDGQKSLGIDSGGSYSLYLEYVYGEARTRYPNAEIPKQLYMKSDNEEVKVPFFAGTQMTLIDLEDGNKPYYYTVQASDGDKIDFTSFKDSENNAYKLKNINACTEYVGESVFQDVCNEKKSNVAVERYLLLIDTVNVNAAVKAGRGNALYALHTDISQMRVTDSRLYNRIDYTEHCIARISETMGMTSVFTENHILEGEISKDGNVTLTMEYNVNMSDVWKSANAGNAVYLDLAIGLERTVNNNTQSLSLPTGTQVFFEKKTTDAEGNVVYERSETPYVVHGSGINHVYYYADSGSEKNIMTLPAGVDNIEAVRIILDFSMADMSVFKGESEEVTYGIAADLLIATDKESPANGEVKDFFRASVVVNVASELGFALQPEDMMTLGINRYQPEESDEGIIPFTAKIAFPEDYQLTDVENKYYGIVYRIEKKTVQRQGITKPEYEAYTGSDIVLYYGDSVETGNTLTPIRNNAGYYQYYSMTYSQLTVSGNIAEAPFVLAAKGGVDFTNYRVTGYLLISDTAIIDPIDLIQAGERQEDFFVYTVAKVKTEITD